MAESAQLRVIDIFAGPGGLGEGFSAFATESGGYPFRISLSIEKDSWAHRTLRFRSFFRQFDHSNVHDIYYEVLQQKVSLDDLPDLVKKSAELRKHWENADREAMQAELGGIGKGEEITRRIRAALDGKHGPWVLIGGPPCQAYSVVGRSRNKGISDYSLENDHRSTLYRQYLRIIADFWPDVFVMENVKGLLSATAHNRKVFEQIVADLQSPLAAFGDRSRISSSNRYRIVPLIKPSSLLPESYVPKDYIVPCEQFGVPQVRHRVILVGIREDYDNTDLPPLLPTPAPSVSDIIYDLPPLRSGVSRQRSGGKYVRLNDSPDLWRRTILEHSIRPSGEERRWLKSLSKEANTDIYSKVVDSVVELQAQTDDRGAEFIPLKSCTKPLTPLQSWYQDDRIGGVCNHESRAHMDTDLARYLFAACYASVRGVSPKLSQFPADLQPAHQNAATGDFDDRFRVQVANRPATTVTSHISKDGHYFIHPDPTQCRSLTVREAARLQTFPDNYFFCGPRTSQYTQVGNAVPPWIARQIAASIWGMLVKSGKVS